MATPTPQKHRVRATLNIQTTPQNEPVPLVAFDLDLAFTLESRGDGSTAVLKAEISQETIRADVARALRHAAGQLDPDAEPDVWSNSLHGDTRLTWREKCEQLELEVRRLSAFATIVSDLDRNEHGRHEGELDSYDPTGLSQGNPHIRAGQVFAYTVGGRWAYALPAAGDRHHPAAWVVKAPELEAEQPEVRS